MTRFFLLAVFGCSCTLPDTTPQPDSYSRYLNPKAKFVRERRLLADPATASISELALSIPTYETESVEKYITRESFKISPKGDAWILLGDGGQCPVSAKRLTAVGENPVRLKVVIGTSPGITPVDYAAFYELEKVSAGWKVLKVREGTSAALLKWPMDDSL